MNSSKSINRISFRLFQQKILEGIFNDMLLNQVTQKDVLNFSFSIMDNLVDILEVDSIDLLSISGKLDYSFQNTIEEIQLDITKNFVIDFIGFHYLKTIYLKIKK